ncbi:S4 domain-containing protein YaaA [Bacillus rubiinfantis]|uniref:S4 domain-containing protein YaaA n=1 Tax=Bacillus rubiinfantis TaxID=1499680 RepID=UPI0009E50560|nr:S4 domain-containing protein YaaA [Bacillus rubiinfantis]
MIEGDELPEKIKLDTEFITLGQFLKLADIIQSGGMAKWFLNEHEVFINGEQDQRRGRKLRTGDRIQIVGVGEFVITE